jgi:hypothetical protein
MLQNARKANPPPTCYILSPEELDKLSKWLEYIKVTFGYLSNIHRYLDMKNEQIVWMKSHDYRLMITMILQVAIRGLTEPWIRMTLLDLYNFFDVISQKLISKKRYPRLHDEMSASVSYYVSLGCTFRPHSLM